MDHDILKRIIETVGTPTFVYDETVLRANVRRIRDAASRVGFGHRLDLHSMYFTNSNPHLFSILAEESVGAGIQSVEELQQLRNANYGGEMIVSGTALSDANLDTFLGEKLLVHVSLLDELDYVASTRTDRIGLRLDMSPMQELRQGMKLSELNDAVSILGNKSKELYSLHGYPGAGHSVEELIVNAREVLKVRASHFPDVGVINLGGGFGFDYQAIKKEDQHFDWRYFFTAVRSLLSEYQVPTSVKIGLEPSRVIFVDAGELITQVYRIHETSNNRVKTLWTDGSYVLMPSARMRERQHQVEFYDPIFTEITASRESHVRIGGDRAITNDWMLPGIYLAPSALRQGDYVVVNQVGAYAASQHLSFMNKRPPAEVLLKSNGDELQLLVQRGDPLDGVRNHLREPTTL